MLRDTAQQFVTEHAPVARLRALRNPDHEDGFDRGLWQQTAELGWQGLPFPESVGGAGLGFVEMCTVLEAAGRELMPEPWISTLLLGGQALLLGGGARSSDVLEKIAQGSTIVTLSYDGAVTATAQGQDVVIDGDVQGVFDAHAADAIVVLARANGRGSLYLVDRDAPGVTIIRQRRVDLLQAGHIELRGVAVAQSARVGEPGQGDAIVASVVDRAKIGVSAMMLGASERALEITLEYLKQREQFGVAIGTFQALQHRAARLYIEIALMRSAVIGAASAVDHRPDDVPKLAALAKGIASDAALKVAKEAIQMHGGIGVTDEHDIGFYIKRAQGLAVAFGNVAFQRKRWAKLNGY